MTGRSSVNSKLISWTPRCLAILVLAVASGCGSSGPELGYVTGTVTLDGKPVNGATLIFSPQDGKGTTSSGQTDAEGHYKLMFTFKKEGVMLGKHDVKIEKATMGAEEVAEAKRLGLPASDAVRIPSKYGKIGQLSAEVKGGSQTIDFALVK